MSLLQRLTATSITIWAHLKDVNSMHVVAPEPKPQPTVAQAVYAYQNHLGPQWLQTAEQASNARLNYRGVQGTFDSSGGFTLKESDKPWWAPAESVQSPFPDDWPIILETTRAKYLESESPTTREMIPSLR